MALAIYVILPGNYFLGYEINTVLHLFLTPNNFFKLVSTVNHV